MSLLQKIEIKLYSVSITEEERCALEIEYMELIKQLGEAA